MSGEKATICSESVKRLGDIGGEQTKHTATSTHHQERKGKEGKAAAAAA